jgi:hypothetical protein
VSPTNPEDPLEDAVVDGLRQVRHEARETGAERARPPDRPVANERTEALPSLESQDLEEALPSPEREELNRNWNVAVALDEPGVGTLAKVLGPLRAPLQRLLRFALGPVVERQASVNSAQVKFDNEIVRYLDQRLDRMSRHYDRVLGLHGKRMEEIDERHLILQQELVRHVHDLVQRIEFVFEAAEQNHLYLEGMLRESREELTELAERLVALSKGER